MTHSLKSDKNMMERKIQQGTSYDLDKNNLNVLVEQKKLKQVNELFKAIFPYKNVKKLGADMNQILPLIPDMQIEDLHTLQCKHILTSFCKDLEELMSETRIALLLYNTRTENLSVGASPSVPLSFFEMFTSYNLRWVIKKFGLEAKEIKVLENATENIPDSPLPEVFKEHFAKYAIASTYRYPFLFTGEIYAIISIYSSNPFWTLNKKEKTLLEEQVIAYRKEIEDLAEKCTQYSPGVTTYSFAKEGER